MKNKIIALSLFLAGQIAASHAAVIVVAPTASTPGSFEITDDITFTITTPGTAQLFVFDNWVATPDPQTNSQVSPSLSFSFNGGDAFTSNVILYDNVGFPVGALTANDGIISNNSFANFSFSVSPGDTLTLKAGAYSLPINSDFNPLTTQIFTGDMFIADGNATRLSDNVTTAIPEPSSAALLFGVVSAFALARRRSRGNA